MPLFTFLSSCIHLFPHQIQNDYSHSHHGVEVYHSTWTLAQMGQKDLHPRHDQTRLRDIIL